MPSRQITLVNYPPSPKQKKFFCELSGFSRFPVNSICTRQGCHLAIKALVEGRDAGLMLDAIEFPRQVFVKEWNKDYTVKEWGTAQAMSALKLATLNEIAVKAVVGKAVKTKLSKLIGGVDPAKVAPEDKAAEVFDGIIAVRRGGQIK
jgi:hypothetical protein